MKPVRLAIVVGLCMALVWSMLPVERALGQGGISGQIGLIRGALTSLGFPEPRVREGAYGFPQTAEMTSTLPVDFKPGAVQTFVRVGIRMPGDAAGVFENNSSCAG